MGQHLLKSWSSTQAMVSLSSGEAEFYGVTKAAGIGLGYQALLRDLGISMEIRVWTDSTATIGICGRQGLGKLRHIDTRSLWLQQRLREGGIELRKIRGEVNPADLFTKHLASEERVRSLCTLFGCRFTAGRAAGAPELRRTCEEGRLLAVEGPYEITGKTVIRDGYTYPGVMEDDELLPDAYLHDEGSLPHRLGGDVARLFPRAIPGAEEKEEEEHEDWLEARATKMRTHEDPGVETMAAC